MNENYWLMFRSYGISVIRAHVPHMLFTSVYRETRDSARLWGATRRRLANYEDVRVAEANGFYRTGD